MKTIDSEVSNFQQRMTKSMKDLMQAFDDGMQAVEKAKKEEPKVLTQQRMPTRGQALGKVTAGMSTLEALTQNLKSSFSDEPKLTKGKKTLQIQAMSLAQTSTKTNT